MPKPKNGTIKIKHIQDEYELYIQKATNEEVYLLTIAESEFEQWEIYNKSKCEYVSRKGKIEKVFVNDNKIFPSEKHVENKNKEKKRNDSDMSINLYGSNNDAFLVLPQDTRKIINANEVENFHLKLNKLVHFLSYKSNKLFLDANQEERAPTLFIKEFQDKNNNKEKKYFKIDFDFPKAKIKNLNNKQKNLLENELNLITKSINYRPVSRLIVGLGNASVYETSISLHHIYGIPYIPGSAVKGIVRSWIIQTCFGEDKQAEIDAEAHPLFQYIFGAQQNQGHVWFFDAYPQHPPVIEADIMNVHYPDYYGKGKPPTDTQNPNPIPFVTVGPKAAKNKGDGKQADQVFRFYIGVKKDPKVEEEEDLENFSRAKGVEEAFYPGLSKDETVLSLTLKFLEKALEHHGIGAKTAVGYGRMTQ